MLTSRAWASVKSRSVITRGIMTAAGAAGRTIKFGPFEVTNQVSDLISKMHLTSILTTIQVFLTTPHSFALVNLKPLIPGHVLVCPHNPHKRLTDLTPTETADLFTTVQLTQRLLARAHFRTPEPEAGSYSVAVQDGADAGQTVPHVHVHVVPRTAGDMGSPDAVYVKLAGEEGNVGGALWDREMGARPQPGGGLSRVDDEDRKPRSAEEMVEEAERYKAILKEMGIQ